MEVIEPMKFEAKGNGFDIDDEYRSRLQGFGSAWDRTHDFLLHNALSEYFDELSPKMLREKYLKLIQEKEINKIGDVSPHTVDHISPELPEAHESGGPTSALYVTSDSIIIPNQRQEGVFYILSNNKNKARKLRSYIVDDFVEMAYNYEYLGIKDIEIKYGDEFTIDSLLDIDNVSEVNCGECDNFEQQVYEELEPLSEAFVNNATVDFGGYAANPECDVILSLSPRNSISIEVKDYSGVDKDPSENDIIDTPLKTSSLLDLNLTITVVKGVDDSKMANFKRSAELRDRIKILQKDDVLEHVRNHIEENLPHTALPRFGWRHY